MQQAGNLYTVSIIARVGLAEASIATRGNIAAGFYSILNCFGYRKVLFQTLAGLYTSFSLTCFLLLCVVSDSSKNSAANAPQRNSGHSASRSQPLIFLTS